MDIIIPISGLLIIAIGSIGIGVSLLTSIAFLVTKGEKHFADFFIILLLFICGLTLLNDVLTTSGISNRFKNLYFIPIFFSLSIGPLFYLFIKSKITQRFSKTEYVHLIIPLCQFLIYLMVGFRSVEYKSELWMNPIFRGYDVLETILFPLSLFFYGLLSYQVIRKPKKYKYFWNDDQIQWLKSMNQVFITIAILESINFIGQILFAQRFGSHFYVVRITIYVLFILWITYNIYKILNPNSIYKTNPATQVPILSEEDSESLKNTLLQLFENDKVFLNGDLNLRILAEYLRTTEKTCSYLLSNELETNFNNFVNSYRIKAFKEKVLAGEHEKYTLLSIAYSCGFQSKSTFNRAFKLQNGMTPSAYVKLIKT